MTDLIREIEGDVRRDAVEAFIRKYLALIIGVLIAAVIAISSVLIWRTAQERAALNDAATFGMALQQFENDNAQAGFETLEQLSRATPGYRLLSRFEAASRALAANDLEAALGQWDSIIASQQAASQYQHLATLFKAMALADAQQYAPALETLGQIPDSNLSFAPKAQELSGLILWDQGELARALAQFEALRDLLETDAQQALSRQSVTTGVIELYIEQLNAALS